MPRRLLIADDDERIRSLVRSEVEEFGGFEVCAMASNGTEAVEAAMALRPDLLILDILMPGLNGIEVAGVLRKTLPRAKIILFTLHSDIIGSQMIATLGAKLISKVEGFGALRRALREILDSKTREVDEALGRVIRDRTIDAESLNLLIQQVSVPLTRCGRDLKYVWVNDCYAEFLRRPASKIVGHSILDVVGKNAFDLLQGYFDQALRGKDVSYEAEVEYQSAGLRRIAASYKSTFDGDGSPDGWMAYIEDVTVSARRADDPQSPLTQAN